MSATTRQNRIYCSPASLVWGLMLVFVLIPVACTDNSEESETPVTKSTDSPFPVSSQTGEVSNENHLKMDFLWCNPGQFLMGSPKDEPERGDDENQVNVTLTHGFWLGKFEVTQEQWKAVMNTEPWVGQADVQVAPDQPACWVSWQDAEQFCRELTRQEREAGALPDGWQYILPTEAQWEYACRAGTTTKFSFGDDDSKLIDYAWYGERERGNKELHAYPVGQKLPNPWGFHDMHGNVVEWCRDWYQPEYPGGTDPYVATEYNNRITCRGGEWRIELKWARSASRQMLRPVRTGATIGFRVSLQQVDSEPPPTAGSLKLAIVPFENRGTSVAYGRIGQELAGMVASDLSELAALDVLERQTTEGLLTESTLAKAGVTQDGANRDKPDFADYVLTGTFSVSNEQLTVVAKLSKPGIDKPQAEWTLQRQVDQLSQLEEQLAEKVIAALSIDDTRRTSPQTQQGEAPTVAILPLINNSASARLDDMQVGFAEVLQSMLGELEGVRLVDRQQIDQILKEQKLTLSGLVDPASAIQVGKLLGAQRLLSGSFLELDKQLSIQVRVVDTGTAAVVGSAKVTGPDEHFDELMEDLTRDIAAKLEIALTDKPDDSATRPRAARSLEVALHLATGDRLRREGNFLKAAEAYQQAILIEPNNAVHHYRRLLVLAETKDWENIVKTAEHALSFPDQIERLRSDLREYIIEILSVAYYETGRYEAVLRLQNEYGHLTRRLRIALTAQASRALIKQKRFAEAERLMVEMAKNDEQKFGLLQSQGMQELFL
ncbi:MAG: SUMF1/EgtB/PvdO family nonheme iron enzyme, partial [Planctomycetaceae bacterium]|nr:SUMF1/EgtB/PvdO family nonheme iron enzyme [Planctomycetaceae bacterium]